MLQRQARVEPRLVPLTRHWIAPKSWRSRPDKSGARGKAHRIAAEAVAWVHPEFQLEALSTASVGRFRGAMTKGGLKKGGRVHLHQQ